MNRHYVVWDSTARTLYGPQSLVDSVSIALALANGSRVIHESELERVVFGRR
jgi:hypothetical protein